MVSATYTRVDPTMAANTTSIRPNQRDSNAAPAAALLNSESGLVSSERWSCCGDGYAHLLTMSAEPYTLRFALILAPLATEGNI